MHLAGKVLLVKWPGNSARLLLKYGLVGNVCYCFTVVDVAPTGQIKSKRLSACLEEVEKKKRTGESLLNEAKRMRLASLTPSEVGIFFRPYKL